MKNLPSVKELEKMTRDELNDFRSKNPEANRREVYVVKGIFW
jgi:hypothetical protein